MLESNLTGQAESVETQNAAHTLTYLPAQFRCFGEITAHSSFAFASFHLLKCSNCGQPVTENKPENSAESCRILFNRSPHF